MFGKIILGVLILIAVIVFVNPEYTPQAWNLAMTILKIVFWAIIVILIVLGIIFLLAIVASLVD